MFHNNGLSIEYFWYPGMRFALTEAEVAGARSTFQFTNFTLRESMIKWSPIVKFISKVYK